MHRLIAVLTLLAMVACGRTPDAVAPQVFRATDAQIYSSAVLDMARLSGDWVQVAGFAAGGQAACGPGQVRIGDGQITWNLCLADGPAQGAGVLQPGKPGRFAVPNMADWWVLWADADYRTLVIGTPSGQFGFVLNRSAQLPSDRVTAVRDIFQFNSYDLGKLTFFN